MYSIENFYNIIVTRFRFVDRVSDIVQYLHTKCQVTAVIFVDVSKNTTYENQNDSNVRRLTMNKQLRVVINKKFTKSLKPKNEKCFIEFLKFNSKQDKSNQR